MRDVALARADLGDSTDLAPACGQQRTDRQDLVAGLLVGSLAAAGGGRRRDLRPSGQAG